MKLTLKIPAEVFARLEIACQEGTCPVEEMAAHWLFIASRTHAEMEEIEDEVDAANAERVLAQSDPPRAKPWTICARQRGASGESQRRHRYH